jgi:diaminopimelate decarboxylase
VSNTLADALLLEDGFGRRGEELAVGGISVRSLAAIYGTPLYVYDADRMQQSYRRLSGAVAGFAEVFYSIKANPNPAVARVFVEEGAGIEIASGGEFLSARAAGCRPERMLFAGPGKSYSELTLALEAGLGEVHLESIEEITHVTKIARKLGRRVQVALRINPVAKAQGGAMRMGGRPTAFGFDEEGVADIVSAIESEQLLDLAGVHLYPGTQILDADVLLSQWQHALELAKKVALLIGRPLRTIDLGGGLGVPYHPGDTPLDLAKVANGVPALIEVVQTDRLLRDARVILEPGRYLTASGGTYLVSVRSAKVSRGVRFVVTDGGMHHHLAASGNLGQFIKRDYPIVPATRLLDAEKFPTMVVGPLCTPLDTLGRQTELPNLAQGDLLAVLQSGAYGLTASPTGFLSHPLPAEVLVEGGQHRLIRPPGTFAVPFTVPI